MHIARLRLFPLSIPLRRPFHHAAHARTEADPLVVEVELGDGTLGYGETLPRPYVSGETLASVIATIHGPLAEDLVTFAPTRFAEALERIDGLPMVDATGAVMTAARAGVELALLDAYSRSFERPISDTVGWLGLPGFGPPGSVRQVCYSGVVSGQEVSSIPLSVKKMRWFGLRDFKLKVGFPDDVERVRTAARALGDLLKGNLTLRLDANGGWTLDEAITCMRALAEWPISCVEQPFDRLRDSELPVLKEAVNVRIMHDESLLTVSDAERLHSLSVADAFNIRLGKNGGFLGSLRLVEFARRHGIRYQLGCLVGETSILSAAGRRFLENVPGVWFAEGSYGRFLLRGDVVSRPVQFGCGGVVRPLPGLGWGIEVRPDLLERYVVDRPLAIPL